MVAYAQYLPSLPALIESRAAAFADAPAVVASDRTFSYAELRAAAATVAGALAQRGIGPGSIVGVCVDRDSNLIPVLLGVLWSGAAYIPIDSSFPVERLRHMLEDARPGALLVSERHRGLFEGAEPPIVPVEELIGGGGRVGAVRPLAPPLPAGAPRPEDLAYVIYTSGSTGRPKGVMIEHRGLSNALLSMLDLVSARPGDRMLAVTTVSFDITAVELFLPLLVGGTVVLAQPEEALDGRALARMIDRHGITLLQATPGRWRVLIESGWKGSRRIRAMIGGEAVRTPLANAILERVGALWNVYGPTETTIWSTAHRVEAGEDPIPIGRAIANTTLRLLDEHMRPAGEGELFIGGVGLARGYLNRDDLTASRFIPDPFAEGERLYRTGDLCRWREDGELEFIGRVDHQVKIRGYRVELGDVEAALAGDDDIEEAVVGTRGQDENISLVAYIKARPGASLTLAELRRRVAPRLPAYMVPTALVLVDCFPRTPAGKTDRAALAALAEQRESGSASAETAATTDDTELAVLGVFRDILNLERLTPTDDFFDVGGQSLLAFRAAQELERRTGVPIDVGSLFKNPTARGLAAELRQRGGIAVPATAVDLQRGGHLPTLFCVCGVAVYHALARALAPEQPVCAIYVDTDLDVFHSSRADSRLTIEAMADRYVEQVRLRQPRGPYRLLGFSMGGSVALEVARRLVEAGERVETVIMLDSILMESVRRRPLAWARRALRDQSSIVGLIRRAVTSWRDPAPPPPPVAAGADDRALRQALSDVRAHAILSRYRPRRCPVDVLFFNAAGRPRPEHFSFDETGGWGRIVGDRLRVRMVQADHFDLLTSPAVVASVAAGIREHLRPVNEAHAHAGAPLAGAA